MYAITGITGKVGEVAIAEMEDAEALTVLPYAEG